MMLITYVTGEAGWSLEPLQLYLFGFALLQTIDFLGLTDFLDWPQVNPRLAFEVVGSPYRITLQSTSSLCSSQVVAADAAGGMKDVVGGCK